MNNIPVFGAGTFRLTGQTVIDSVHNALDVGYRAIDTAQIYGNEADIGQAIAQSGVSRSELFITTKIWTDNYAKARLAPSLRESLEKLRTDYVDLTLIHWPAPGNGVALTSRAGNLGLGTAIRLRGDPIINQAREPGQQPAGTRSEAGCRRYDEDRRAGTKRP